MVRGNIKTNTFLASVLNAEFSATTNPPTRGRVGMGTSTPSVTDTSLSNPYPVTGTETLDNCETASNWTGGTDCSLTDNTTVYKVGSGSLNLIKTGTTQTSAFWYNNNNMNSLNITSKDLKVWLYIKDAATMAKISSTGVQLAFGNDYNTNIYTKTFAKSSLSVGWNLLSMNTSDSSESGSVTLTSIDSGYLLVFLTATSDTFAAGDLLLDEWVLVESADYYKAFVASYPVVTASELKAEERFKLTTTEANAASITEHATFDASGNMKSRCVYNAVDKNSSTILTFVNITKVRNKEV